MINPRVILLVATFLLPGALVSGGENTATTDLPLYRIPLRVHWAESSRTEAEFQTIFMEINKIWQQQAQICFEIEADRNEEATDAGLKMWFRPMIGGWNGSYDGEIILMKDRPVLAPAPHPAGESAARTAAHELGHALGLHHDQSDSDNLMASKTYGWRLNPAETKQARQEAAKIARSNAEQGCSPPKFLP